MIPNARLVALALLGHILSAFVTFGASSPDNAYGYLFWGMFIFAYANGTLEGVANPLVATLFPKNRTHYLNILHASWPAGLVLGSVVGGMAENASYVWGIPALVPLAALFYAIALFPGKRAEDRRHHCLVRAPAWIAPIYFPIEVISHLSRVLSLSLRLFGNVFRNCS